jgi:hypothetical protein
LGDVVAVVDGVEISGCSRVAHERITAEWVVSRGDHVTDREGAKA